MSSRIKRSVGAALIVATLAFMPLRADAYGLSSTRRARVFEGGKKFDLGIFGFLPKLLFKTAYEDNALYSAQNREWDVILNAQPGLDIDISGSKFDFVMHYDLSASKNMRTDAQNFLGHDLGGEFSMTPFGRRVFIRLADNYSITSEPADAELMERMGVKSNEASAEVGYVTPGQDMEISLAYVNDYKSYEEIWDGSTYHGNGIELKSKLQLSSKYRFLPKTQATFDFNYTRAKQTFGQNFYGRDVVSDGYRFLLGVVGAFTRKLSIVTKVGYNRTVFNIDESSSDLLVDAGINYNFTRKIAANAGYSRKIEYSVYSPYKTFNNYNFKLSYKATNKLSFKARLDFDDIDYSGPVTNGAGALRNDFNTRFNLESIYRIKKWLNIIGGYSFQNRDSNMTRNELLGTVPADFMRNSVYVGLGINRF